MQHKHTVQVPATTRVETLKVTCDICSAEIPQNSHLTNEIAETTVECRVGKTFPGESWHTSTRFDICVACFMGELVPWLASRGAKPTLAEVEY